VPKEMKLIYIAQYRDLYCENIEKLTDIKEKIDNVVQAVVKTTTCIDSKSCEIKYDGVTNCYNKTHWKRSERQAGFGLQIIGRSGLSFCFVFFSLLFHFPFRHGHYSDISLMFVYTSCISSVLK
jgi:hypothetical protein